ncbi:MAG: diguanylate cyclase domain-containing protein [Acidimicrobiales bacterium]
MGTSNEVAPCDAKDLVDERVGGLQNLGSRALLVTMVVAECVAILALLLPADTTSSSVRVLLLYNALLLCALAAWRRSSDAVRRAFLYVILTISLLRWSFAWWGDDLDDTHIAVVATLVQIPTLLIAVFLMHPKRIGLGIGMSWLMTLGGVAFAGAQRAVFADGPLSDWRLGPFMVAMNLGLLIILGWWVREHEDFLTASREQIELIDAANLDPLTGLANRRSIHHHLDGLHRIGHVSVVALLDIDHFKSINDSFGHEGGDAVLCRVADELSGAIRPIDVVGRWGGEEFVVVAKGLDPTLAEQLVERLRSVVTAADITASVGWTLWDPAKESWNEAMHRADVALYEAKESGRDRAVSA